MIDKLQYITQETNSLTHIDCVREACIAGVSWIQLRVKGKTLQEYQAIAEEAKIICDLYDTRLIINDNVELAKKVEADGVHLGKSDMKIAEAREILGYDAIIGGTANDLNDVYALIEEQVNYIGLGPYKYTHTKKELSPTLGISGYHEIINELKSKYLVNEIPIIAVGGIEQDDIEDLLTTGVYGIAVSGLLTRDFNLLPELYQTL